jgi:RHS repeat-associated protein
MDRGAFRLLPLALVLVVVCGLSTPVSAVAAPPAAPKIPAPVRPVPSKPAPGHDLKPAPVRPAAVTRRLPARALPAAATAALRPGARTDVGGLPVTVASAATVAVLGQPATVRAKLPGVLLRVTPAAPARTTRLTVAYGRFRDVYGGDWAARLRLWRVPDCGLSTPDSSGCAPTPVRARNDAAAGTLTADAAAGLLALAAGQSGPTGDYTATSLTEAGSWQVGESSGSFNWSYPFRLPPAPGDLLPDLAVSYSSGSVDGRTSSENAQPSAVGEGWDLWPGYIERRYRTCSDDGTSRNTSDLCWGPDNLTLSLNGRSTALVRDDTTHAWHPRSDDGSFVEQVPNTVNGTSQHEAFKVTTQDGTQYFFGSQQLPGFDTATNPGPTNSVWTVPVFGNDAGEPCLAGCPQGYRWNLDYVLDRHGNAISYYYRPEGNKYGLSGSAYVRGGTLAHVDYGFRNGHAYDTTGPARPAATVTFTPTDRCDPEVAGCTSFPDTPRDQTCTAAPCTAAQAGPTFWSDQMLSTITTKVLKSGVYSSVDQWTLTHSFPKPPDGQAPALWLGSIVHSGLVGGTIALPPITFDQTPLQNRVDAVSFPAQVKFRIKAIHTDLGGTIDVDYAPQECSPSHLPAAPESDTMRCFAQFWSPAGEGPPRDWFHKYVVESVTEADLLLASDPAGGSPPKETHYAYGGKPAWHFTDADEVTPAAKRTWSDWRGYGTVTVTTGASTEQRSQIVDTFYRGMDGDHLPSGTRDASVTDSTGTTVPDSDGLAGQVREHTVLNGPGGAEVSGSISTPFLSASTARHTHVPADGITVAAVMVRQGSDAGRTDLSGNRRSHTLTSRSYDSAGRLSTVDNQGDTSTSADDLCTTNEYITDDSRHILALPFRTTVVGKACGAGDPVYPGDGVSQVQTFYDGSTVLGQLPTAGKGDVTMVKTAKAFNGSGPSAFVTTSATFDSYGRALTQTDAAARTTTYTYSGQPMTASSVTTAPATAGGTGLTTTIVVEPAWGTPLSTTDPNKNVTAKAYDPLGRLTGVWLPDRPKTATSTPNVGFGYQVSNTTASWQRTDQLAPSTIYLSSYTLYDGLGRERQTQTPAEEGRLVTDTFYDTRGHPRRVFNLNFTSEAPTGTVFISAAQDVLSETDSVFDGADRATAVITKSRDTELWRSTNTYGGDHVDVTPPAGGTPTTSIVDAAGRTTELRQHHGSTYDATTYAYTRTGQLDTVTAPGGARWHYEYDVLHRPIASTTPDSGRSTMDYDDAGDVTASTDSRGRTIAYGYDGMGRKTGAFDGSLTGAPLSQWTYDTVPGPAGTPTLGAPASTIQYVGTDKYTEAVTGYDVNGRSLGESVTIPAAETGLAGTYNTTTSYAPDGSPGSIGYPAAGGLPAENVRTVYDAAGLPKQLRGTTTYVTDSRYDGNGNPAAYNLSTGTGTLVQLLYTFDRSTGRLTNQSVARQTATDSQPTNIAYTYDDAGDLTSASDTGNGHPADTQCYSYDYLQRLTEAWTPAAGSCAAPPAASALGGPAPYWQSYSYDVTGNRTQLVQHATAGDTTATYTYPAPSAARPHTLSSVTTTGPGGSRTDSFGYDVDGHTTARPGQTLAWDAQGRLASATTSAGTTTYRYDADGSRLIERDPTGATLFLPNGMEVRYSVSSGTTSATRYYTHNGATVAMRTPAGVTWLASDPHGTVQSTLNPSTGAITSRRSDPFGNIRGTAPTPWDSHGFLNAPIDPGTGLTHLGAREYDPTLGRFISADPVTDTGSPQQLNGYAYADNNPTTSSDPSGLLPKGCLDTCGADEPTYIDQSGAVRHRAPRGSSGSHYVDGDGCNPGLPLCGGQRTRVGPTVNWAKITHRPGYTYVNNLLVVSGNPQLDTLVWQALQLNARRGRMLGGAPSLVKYKPVPEMSPAELASLLREACGLNPDLCTDSFVAGLDAAAGLSPEPAKPTQSTPARHDPRTGSLGLCGGTAISGCGGFSRDSEGHMTADTSVGVGVGGSPVSGYGNVQNGTAGFGLSVSGSACIPFLCGGFNLCVPYLCAVGPTNGGQFWGGTTTSPIPSVGASVNASFPADWSLNAADWTTHSAIPYLIHHFPW